MADTRTLSNSVQGVAIVVFLGGIFDIGLGMLFLLQAGAPGAEIPAEVIRGVGITTILIGSICGAAAVGFWRLRRWAWTVVTVFLWIDVCFRGLTLLLGGVTLVETLALCFFLGLLFLVYRVRPSFAPQDARRPLRCPRCGHAHASDANYCPRCGGDLDRSSSGASPPAPAAEPSSPRGKPPDPHAILSGAKDGGDRAGDSHDDESDAPA